MDNFENISQEAEPSNIDGVSGSSATSDSVVPTPGMSDIPDEILELILNFLSPYQDFQSAMLVCKRWHSVMQGVKVHTYQGFHKAIEECAVQWQSQAADTGPTISQRFSHSACYHNKSLYVFGGCTAKRTTFNDLWRFDLANREWVRPFAVGSYPSPKASASLVSFRDYMILFGGWNPPNLMPLHQPAKYFDQLHIYNPSGDRWHQVTTLNGPAGMAGHKASVLGDYMLVYGGYQGHTCNDIWLLDCKHLKGDLEKSLSSIQWIKKRVEGPGPPPRYGHSQVVIGQQHLLILGGCGGPNRPYLDVWLLDTSGPEWQWREMKVEGADHSPPHMSLRCHPACKVGDRVVMLSKNPKVDKVPLSAEMESRLRLSKPWLHSESNEDSSGSAATTELSKFVGFKRPRLPDTSESSSQDSSSDNDDMGHHHAGRGPAQRGTVQRRVVGGNADRTHAARVPASRRMMEDCNNLSASTCDDGHAAQNNPTTPATSGGTTMEPCGEQQGSDVVPPEGDTPVVNPGGAAAVVPSLQSSQNLQEQQQCATPPSDQSVHECRFHDSGLAGLSGTGGGGGGSRWGSRKPSREKRGEHTSPMRLGMPSVRPNAMRDRQRQLDTLRKYEEKIRNMARAPPHNNGNVDGKQDAAQHPSTSKEAAPAKPSAAAASSSPGGALFQEKKAKKIQNPMFVHVLDVRGATTEGTVSWQPVCEHTGIDAPEETIFYSLVEGRAEIIMFGGIQTELNSMLRGIQQKELDTTNAIHFIKGLRILR